MSRATSLNFSLPPSKSISNRLVFAMGLYPNKLRIAHLSRCSDTQVFIQCMEDLGASYEMQGDLFLTKKCLDIHHLKTASIHVKDCGLALRFFLVLGALQTRPLHIEGFGRLLSRPLQALIKALETMGACIEYKKGKYLSVYGPIRGKSLSLGELESSQYVSAILMLSPFINPAFCLELRHPLPSAPYVEMTLQVLNMLGISVKKNLSSFSLQNVQKKEGHYQVEGDLSSASYLLAASLITGRPLFLKGMRPSCSWQGDRLGVEHLLAIGAEGIEKEEGFEFFPKANLQAFDIDFSSIPDLALTFGVLAATISQPCVLRGLEHLKGKESDRLKALRDGLIAVGAIVKQDHAKLIVKRGQIRPCLLPGYGDHRVVMAFSLLKLLNRGVAVEGEGSCLKSYPHFFDDLQVFMEE